MNDMTDKSFDASAKTVLPAPDTTVDVRETFGTPRWRSWQASRTTAA